MQLALALQNHDLRIPAGFATFIGAIFFWQRSPWRPLNEWSLLFLSCARKFAICVIKFLKETIQYHRAEPP
jgi:hypothetical protein